MLEIVEWQSRSVCVCQIISNRDVEDSLLLPGKQDFKETRVTGVHVFSTGVGGGGGGLAVKLYLSTCSR